MRDLDDVGAKESHFDDEQRNTNSERTELTPVPLISEHLEKDKRGDNHGHCDSYSISGCQVT